MMDSPKPKGTRTGFTTGANATACVSAALRVLLGGAEAQADEVVIRLPEGQTPAFRILSTTRQGDSVTCATIKDGGDDPDATHGAEIRATVRLTALKGQIRFLQGEGVGKVTKPGLGLEIGGPAINPVPRRMMTEHALERLKEFGREEAGVDITVSVKDGEAIARKTLNARLGILGGISILGRTGIVYPYSNAAYIASIEQGIEVALHQGAREIFLTTGGLTEDYAIKLRPDLDESAFVQMGDHVGKALDHCRKLGVPRIVLVGQIGKVSKLANGQLHTHARKSEVNMQLMADLAREAGAGESEIAEILGANTARHVFEMGAGKTWRAPFLQALCAAAAKVASHSIGGACEVESWLFDFEGNLVGKAGI
jgi:cobalt-precorrin-5B (C1)-methyltransferase